MRKHIGWLVATGFVTLFVLSTQLPGAEEKISKDKIPKAVMDTIQARFKDAAVKEVVLEETEDGDSVYEISMQAKDKTIDAILTPEGKLVLFEQSIAQEDLPKPVAKTLADKYPKATYTYKRLEQVYKVVDGKEKLDFYEALLMTDKKKELEVKLSEDGKVQSEMEVEPE